MATDDQTLQSSVWRNQKLVASIRDNAQRKKECDEEISQINDSIKELNNASIFACQQEVQVQYGNDLEGFQSKV